MTYKLEIISLLPLYVCLISRSAQNKISVFFMIIVIIKNYFYFYQRFHFMCKILTFMIAEFHFNKKHNSISCSHDFFFFSRERETTLVTKKKKHVNVKSMITLYYQFTSFYFKNFKCFNTFFSYDILRIICNRDSFQFFNFCYNLEI